MYIPRCWERAHGDCHLPDGRGLALSAWGWGENEAEARATAKKRLQALIDRTQREGTFPEKYAYGKRPPRETVIETVGSEDSPDAVITRNAVGAEIMNTARLLFLDIDLEPPGGMQKLLARLRLGPDKSEAATIEKLRKTLQQASQASFRIYRTKAGLRVLAIDREFDPVGRETAVLMDATGTDPSFKHLCQVQNSFRARLTPKHWRIGIGPPPGKFPRDSDTQRQFDDWLNQYNRAAESFSTCQFIETVGAGRPRGIFNDLVTKHDRRTRCDSGLPLA